MFLHVSVILFPLEYLLVLGIIFVTFSLAKDRMAWGKSGLKVRVATAQGKQGIWFLLFPDRENTGNFVLTQKIFGLLLLT